jgi:hypothetical protein
VARPNNPDGQVSPQGGRWPQMTMWRQWGCDQNHLSGKSPKVCPAPFAKIFRLTRRPNQPHNSARLTRLRGGSRSSRTCGEMRWTLNARETYAPDAYGEVVWFGRRGAGVKLAIRSAGDGGKRAVHRGELEASRKATAQGRPECSRCPVCSCAVLFAQIARETAGAASTRSSLRPLFRRGPNEDANLGRSAPREGETVSSVIASAAKQSTSPLAALWIATLRSQ